jgi:hypothetical protein
VKLAEWHEQLEVRPLTQNQLGRLHRETERLGLWDRAERLAVAAELLDIVDLGSFTELHQGEAGYLLNVLMNTQDRAELFAAPEPEQPAPGVTLLEMAQAFVMTIASWPQDRLRAPRLAGVSAMTCDHADASDERS